ncbi:MAG TPA: hypothetical protein VN316_00335, partial [candidate division Zixibacteria bacterium]|nr:hypothetical protein [candidate division Zixibacteria bacterium]
PMLAQAPAGYLNPRQRIADIEGAVGQDQQVPNQVPTQPQQAQPIRNQKAPITKQLGDGSWVQWDDYNQAWVPMRGI